MVKGILKQSFDSYNKFLDDVKADIYSSIKQGKLVADSILIIDDIDLSSTIDAIKNS